MLQQTLLKHYFQNCALLTPRVTGTSVRVVIGIIVACPLLEIHIPVYLIAAIIAVIARSLSTAATVETNKSPVAQHLPADSVPLFLVQKRCCASGESVAWFIP